jgi:hypothetical protein
MSCQYPECTVATVQDGGASRSSLCASAISMGGRGRPELGKGSSGKAGSGSGVAGIDRADRAWYSTELQS